MIRIPDDQVQQAYDRAPQAIKAVLDSEDTVPSVVMIVARGQHLDVIGMIAELTRNMLLGLVSPRDFFTALGEMKIADQQARQIMGDINEKIFKPLQARMRGGAGVGKYQEAQSTLVPLPPPPAPRYEPPAPPPQPRPVPPPPPQPSITLPPMPPAGASAAQLRPTPPQPAVQAAPEWQAPPPSPTSSAAPLPPRTVLPGATAPRFIKPMQVAAPEIPRGAPPANLPTHTPPAAAPRVAGASSAAQPEDAAFNALPPLAKPQPLSSQGDPNAPHTRYPADPYREPIE